MWQRPPRPQGWPQQRPVGWGALNETPPIVTTPVVHEQPGDFLFNGILRPAWAYRWELGLYALAVVLHQWLAHQAGRDGADVVILLLAGAVAALPWTREFLARLLYKSHLRRRWALACRHADLATRNDRVPRITKATLTRAEQLRVRVPAGGQVPDLEAEAERIAAFLNVREVRVARDPASARYARVVVLRRDPLADPNPIPWPHAHASRLSLWQPIPVGVDEDGTQVTISLPERNLLLAGEPGAGKSTILQLLVAVAALDPTVRLTLFDPKLVELAVWQGSSSTLVGPDVDKAIQVLQGLLSELEDRYLTLLANKARKVTEGDGLPLYLLGIEELAFYTNGPDTKACKEFATLLRDFVARGRAAGMVTVATTQKPSADVIPTFLRDLFGFRWALRCSTSDASDTILGRGWASQGYSATNVDPTARGVGYLLQEGGVPVRLRACYLDDRALADLALRAEHGRKQHEKSGTPTLRIVKDESA